MNISLKPKSNFRKYFYEPFAFLFGIWGICALEDNVWNISSRIVLKNNSLNAYSTPAKELDKKIKDEIWAFKADAERYGIKVDLSRLTYSSGWMDGEENLREKHIIAACKNTHNHIFFDDGAYSESSPREFRATMYHELAHCLFDIPHDETPYPFPNMMNALDNIFWEEIPESKWQQSKDHCFI